MTFLECLAVWFFCAFLVFAVVSVAAWITDRCEPPEDREARRGIERSGREAAKGRHAAGKLIPPSREVRDHGHGRSVAEAADADPVRIHLDATFNLPAAQERRTT